MAATSGLTYTSIVREAQSSSLTAMELAICTLQVPMAGWLQTLVADPNSNPAAQLQCAGPDNGHPMSRGGSGLGGRLCAWAGPENILTSSSGVVRMLQWCASQGSHAAACDAIIFTLACPAVLTRAEFDEAAVHLLQQLAMPVECLMGDALLSLMLLLEASEAPADVLEVALQKQLRVLKRHNKGVDAAGSTWARLLDLPCRNGLTPLAVLAAAQLEGATGFMRVLIEQGADPGLASCCTNASAAAQLQQAAFTPLQYAIMEGNLPQINVLLECGLRCRATELFPPDASTTLHNLFRLPLMDRVSWRFLLLKLRKAGVSLIRPLQKVPHSSPLQVACSTGQRMAAQTLLDLLAEQQLTPAALSQVGM